MHELLRECPAPPADKWKMLVIICTALFGGLMFCAMMFSFVFGFGEINFNSDMVSLMLGLGGIFGIPLAVLLPRLLVDQPSRQRVQSLLEPLQPDAQSIDAVFGLFQSRTIFMFAILEGLAMANLLFFFVLEYRAIHLLAFILCAAAMMVSLPTKTTWAKWLNRVARSG